MTPRERLLGFAIAICLLSATLGHAAEPSEIPLIEQAPFDRITLNAENDNAVIDVQLLNFPDRKVPSPFPDKGSLQLQRLKDPSVHYEVAWPDIAKIELYEELVLKEAKENIGNRELDRAYTILDFLHQHYPELPGLTAATEAYLQQDAMAAFQGKRYDESMAVLSALYDLNPQRRGLDKAIEGVSDRLISERLANRDFAGARQMLDNLRNDYPELALANITSWQEKFQTGATRQLDQARQSLSRGNYSAARQSVQRALSILPEIGEAAELLKEIEVQSPQIVVGVAQAATKANSRLPQEWAADRISRLVNPRFVELDRIGTEGGEYVSRWATLKLDDAGLQLNLEFNQTARWDGVTPEAVALMCLKMANPEAPEYQPEFADAFSSVEVVGGQRATIRWRFAHLKPQSLLQFPVSSLTPQSSQAILFQVEVLKNPDLVKFTSPPSDSAHSQTILEQPTADDETALEALRRGDLDVVERIAPWQVDQTAAIAGVRTAAFRLPTVHVLLCNYKNPLLKRREFRRALCYGIDRARMMSEIIMGKEGRPGFRVLSGPLPAGITIGDFLGYAYKQELQPLPYEPRLALVLATSARAAVEKIQSTKESNDKAETTDKSDDAEKETPPLVLAYPPDAIPRVTCQLMKSQLTAIGIPIELVEQSNADDAYWDLCYVELCMWEPLVDAQGLLGSNGLAGRCSPTMALALRELNQSTNWNDARVRLQRIHQLAYDDLPVIPLWQTVNYFAHRKELEGIPQTPVSLYQGVDRWQMTLSGNGVSP